MNERASLTARQQECLDIIREGVLRGTPPTIREIGQVMGIRYTNGVSDHIKALERKGYVERDELKSRGIRLVDPVTVSERLEVANPLAVTVLLLLLRTAEREAYASLDEQRAIKLARSWLRDHPAELDEDSLRALSDATP